MLVSTIKNIAKELIMSRVKLALLSIGALVFVACGGGGGGGASSVSVRPSDMSNPQNIIKEPLKKVEEKAKEKVEEKKQDLLNKGNEAIDKIQNHAKEHSLGLLPKKGEKQEEDYPLPTDSKSITGKTQKIAILDSDFLTNRKDLEQKYPGIQVFEKMLGREPDGVPHGERVLEVMMEGTQLQALAGSIGEKGLGGVLPSVSLYKEMWKKFGDQKVKVFNQSWAIPNTIDEYRNLNNTTYEHLLPSYEGDGRNGKALVDFYEKAVDDGGLFVWAAGNRGEDKQTLMQASLQAGLPKLKSSLEKGWISAVGVNPEDESWVDPSRNILNKHYYPHLAYPGMAAPWAIAADGNTLDQEGRGSSFAAPRVARAAALVAEKFPWMSNNQVRQTLFTTTDEVEISVAERGKRRMSHEPDGKYGWGMLNTGRALKGPGAFWRDLLKADSKSLSNYQYVFKADIPEGMESYFENDIYGDSGLEKTGKGRLHLTGNNDYNGKTSILEGSLDIYRKHLSELIVGKDGTLTLYPETFIGYNSSWEKVEARNVDNAGTVKLVGTGANIGGDYIAREGSTTAADFSSRVKVHGKIQIEGGDLQIQRAEYLGEPEEKVLLEGEGIEGKFDTVSINGLREVEAREEGGKLLVRAERANVAKYAEDGSGTLGQASRNMEESFQNLDAKLRQGQVTEQELQAAAALQNMSKEEFLDSSSKLSGEIYASAQALSFAQAQNTNRVLSHRMSEKRGEKLWGTFMASRGELESKAYISADTKLVGGQIGVDKQIGENSLVGLAVSHSEAKADFASYAGKTKSEGYGLSLYGKHSWKNHYYLAGRVGVNRFVSRVEREVLNKEAQTQLGKIKHRDYMFSTYVEAGKEGKYFTPYLAFSYDILRRGSFEEKGAAWGIEAGHKNYYSPQFIYGLRWERDYLKYRLSASLSQAIHLGKRDLDFEGKYIASDVKHRYSGIKQARVTTWAGLGLAREFSNQLSVYGNIDMRWEDSKKKDLLFSTGIQYRF